MRFRPSVDEERLLRAWRLLPSGMRLASEASPTIWRQPGKWTRIALAFLGLIMFGMLVMVSTSLIFAGIVSILVAEGLVIFRRSFHYGVEEMLLALGIGAIFWEMSGELTETVFLVTGIALLLAGWRLLSGWIVAAGAAVLLGWLAVELTSREIVAMTGWALALISAGLQLLEWKRPFTNDCLVAFTFVGYLAASMATNPEILWQPVVGVIVAIALAALGMLGRNHPPLLAALAGGWASATYLVSRLALPLEARLLISGVILLGSAILIDRALSGKRHGVTADRLEEGDVAALVDLTAVATVGVSTQPEIPDDPEGIGAGGGFGGGGATEKF